MAADTARPSGVDDVGTEKEATSAKEDTCPDGPDVDPAELFRLIWGLAVAAMGFLEARWAKTLKSWLPLALELAGRDDAAQEVRRVLDNGEHPSRARLVGATGAVAGVLTAVVGVVSWALAAAIVSAAFRGLSYLVGTSAMVVHAFWLSVFWDPCW